MQVCYVAFWDEITLRAQELVGHRIGENGFIGKWRVVVVKDLPFVDQRLNGKIPKVFNLQKCFILLPFFFLYIIPFMLIIFQVHKQHVATLGSQTPTSKKILLLPSLPVVLLRFLFFCCNIENCRCIFTYAQNGCCLH